jgi:hypothetical protein
MLPPDLQIPRCRCEVCVSEQDLQCPHIGSGFKQVRRKTVPPIPHAE